MLKEIILEIQHFGTSHMTIECSGSIGSPEDFCHLENAWSRFVHVQVSCGTSVDPRTKVKGISRKTRHIGHMGLLRGGLVLHQASMLAISITQTDRLPITATDHLRTLATGHLPTTVTGHLLNMATEYFHVTAIYYFLAIHGASENGGTLMALEARNHDQVC